MARGNGGSHRYLFRMGATAPFGVLAVRRAAECRARRRLRRPLTDGLRDRAGQEPRAPTAAMDGGGDRPAGPALPDKAGATARQSPAGNRNGFPMYTTRRLADYVSGFMSSGLSDAARNAAWRSVLDLMTAAVAGYPTSGAKGARLAAVGLHAPGACAVWFSGRRLRAPGAVLANCAAASMLDLDDGHRAACGHPGAPIIPAALAVAEEINAGADDLLTAIAVGYEVALRVAAARNFEALGTFSSGTWCGYGVVAAAGWLRRSLPGRLAHAFAISGVSAPNQAAAGSSGYSKLTGNNVKEGIPWAAVTGLTALALAEGGFTGPEDILDHTKHFDAGGILDGLGCRFAIEQTYVKPYSCCRWIHAAVDGVGTLMDEHGLAVDDIAGVEIHTFSRALRLTNLCAPATIEEAQYSLPYCVALRGIAGVKALLPLSEDALGRSDVVALAEKVALHLDPELDRRFPAETPARVVMRTTKGRFQRLVEAPRGDPGNPMSGEEIRAKFRIATKAIMSEKAQGELLAAVDSVAAGDLSPLLRSLARPLADEAARRRPA